MPLFIVVLITALVSALPAHAGFLAPIAGAFLGLGSIGTAVLQVGLGVGASLIARSRQPKQKKQGPGAMSLDVPTQGDATPQTIVLGRRAVVGHRTCPEYSRANGLEWLTIVRDLADAPISRLVAIWFGNDRIEMPASFPAWSDPSVFHDLGGKYAGKARLRFHNGTQTQADNFMLWAYADHTDRPWSVDMALRGVPYVIVELKRDAELFPGQPDLLFEVEGMPLFDPRTGQMVASDNLALLSYNVLRGIQLPDGSIYGGQLADVDLPLSVWGPAISEAAAQGWRGGLEVNIGPEDMGGDLPYEIADHLLQGCAGQVAESGGIWRVRVGGPGLPVATITDGDMIVTESQVFTPHLSPREVYNGISAQYPEPDERWEPKAIPLLLDADYVAADGGRNVTSITYHAVSDSRRAQELTQMALDDNRRQRMHEISAPPDYMPIEVLDTVRLHIPSDGYVNKLVEVQAIWRDPVTLNQRMLAREVDPEDYTPPAVSFLPTQPVVTTPPAPQVLPGWAVEAVVVQDSEGRNRRAGVRIRWTPLPAEGIEWQLRSFGQTELAGEGTHQDVERGQRVITAGVISGARMEIRGRAVLRNRARQWTDWTEFSASDVGVIWEDWDAQLREEIQADLAMANQAGDDAREALDAASAIRSDLDDAQALLSSDLATARSELQANIEAAEQLANSNLNIARNYTDTSIGSESDARVAGDQALASQIQTLTAVLNSENYLENPRFTDGLTGWSVTWTGATTVADQDDLSADPVIADAPTQRFVTTVGSASNVRDVRQDFSVTWEANEVFQWRIYAAAYEARTAQIVVVFYDAGGVQIGSSVSTTITLVANQWRVFSGQHIPPAGAASVRFILRVPTTSLTTVVGFADASFTKVDQSLIARITDLKVVVVNNEEAFTLFKNSAESRLSASEAAITNEASTRATADSALAGQITTVSAAANRSKTFWQPTAPNNPQIGDLWFDTENNRRTMRWNGSQWVFVDDTRIEQNAAAITTESVARANADTALAGQITTVSAVANGRNRTFRQNSAPSGAITGDIWYDTANNNRPKRWSGSAWVNTDDTRIDANSAAITSEATARANADSALASQITTVSASANRVRTFRQPSAPDNPSAGDVWYDTNDDNKAYRWSGIGGGAFDWLPVTDSRVVALTATVTTQATAIADLKNGAKAGYLIKAQAGNAVSLIDLIAADGSGQEPVSIIKMQADDIILDGTVSMDKLVVTNLSNLVYNDWTGGDSRGWATSYSTFSVSDQQSSPFQSVKGFMASFTGGDNWVRSRPFPARVDEDYLVEVYALRSGATPPNGTSSLVQMRWETDAGAVYTTVGTVSAGGLQKVSGIVKAPANTVSGSMWVRPNVGGTSGLVYLARPIIRRAADSVMIADGAVIAPHITADTMRALNGRFSSLAAANASVGAAEIKTLMLDGNAVTVPGTQTLANQINGNRTWQNASSISYTLPFAGVASIDWYGSQSYAARQSQAVGLRLRVNGTVIWERITGDPPGDAGIEIDWLSMGWSLNLSAGSHLIQVDWWGGNSNLRLFTRTLKVQGAMR